jgi:hypothetical protein
MRVLLTAVAVLLSCISAISAQQRGPDVLKNAAGTEVVAVINLYNSGGQCVKVKPIQGVVAQRTFDKNGILPISFVLEHPTGERDFFNVETDDISRMSSVQRSWVVQGLQRLLRVGRTVTVEFVACGAAGRFRYADVIR